MRNLRLAVPLALSLFIVPTFAAAQISPALAALPDNPPPQADARGGTPATERVVTWKSLPRDFAHDQKDIWITFPGQLVRGHHWVPVVAVAGVTAGLIYADPHIMPHFQNPPNALDKVNDVFDPITATAYIVAMPASLLAAGYARHDEYQVQTAILCGESYGDAAIVDLAMKAVTRRERPADIPPGGSFSGTFFNGNKSPLKGSAFPSGHSVGAFSVASVIAGRYPQHRWVRWGAYTLATAVSFSRISSMAHFPSDVFLGAAIGYSVGKYEVLRPR